MIHKSNINVRFNSGLYQCTHESTYDCGDVQAAEVGCRPVVDLALGVEPAIPVVSGATPHTASVGQTVQVCPVSTALWVSKQTQSSDCYKYMPILEIVDDPMCLIL